MSAGKKKRRWWIAAAAVLAAGVILARSGGNKVPGVEIARAEIASVTQTASAYGRIRPVRQVKISPDVSGEITDIFFEEGDTVKKGDLLLKIKQESYYLAIARGEASLGIARAASEAQKGEVRLKELEYRRIEALFKSDASCLAKLQQAQIAYETAAARAEECDCRVAAEEASLASAKSELRKTMIYSPMDGILTSLKVKPGERVVGTSAMAGTEMLTIAELSEMEVVVNISENDICSLKQGQKATIKADAAPNITLNGRIDKIATCSIQDGQIGSATDFEIRISIDSQDIIHLLPGMSASVQIITGSKKDILTVPLQSIVVRDGRETVWILGVDGRVKNVEVSCGIQDFSRVEICSGLSRGDVVITGPFQTINKMLHEGDKVKTD